MLHDCTPYTPTDLGRYRNWMARSAVGRRLLVVDADQSSRTVLKHAYELRGHSVVVASSADDAVAAVAIHAPEVVIYDWSFRDQSGLGLASALRVTSSTPMAIVALSVLDEPDGFCARENVDAYIVKPALPEVVERAFEEALTRRRL
jgi:CheY-like chemotaxis protein